MHTYSKTISKTYCKTTLNKNGPLVGMWTKVQALAYLKSLSPVALWVPGMQTDGFRVDGDVIYLTQLTDLSGNGNDAVQSTATAQAYLDGSNAVFSGAQWYVINNSTVSLPVYFIGRSVYSSGYLFDCTERCVIRSAGSILNNCSYVMGNTLNGNWIISSSVSITNGKIGVYPAPLFIGSISTLALYNKTLSTTEQTTVNKCLTILGA